MAMDSFDDFLNEELLNELGVVQQIGRNIARKVGMPGEKLWRNKAAAALGSRRAQGALNLRDTIHQVNDDFEEYAAEQQVHGHATMEDFYGFLRHKVGFSMPEADFMKLAYGADGAAEAPNKAGIEQAEHSLSQAIEKGDAASAKKMIGALAQIAQKGGGDGVQARGALWRVSRHFASAQGLFRPVVQFVGQPLQGQRYNHMLSNVAKLLLSKHKSKSPDDGDTDGTSADGKKGAASNDLKQGDQVCLGRNQIGKKWNSAVLKELLDALPDPCSYDTVKKWVKASASWTPQDAEKIAKKLDMKLSRNQAINITRVLLQCFRDKPGVLKSTFFQYAKNVDSSFEADVINMLSWGRTKKAKKQAADGSTMDVLTYDATAFNAVLARSIQDEAASTNMLVVLLHALYKYWGS